MMPVVAIEFEAPPPPAELRQTFLNACNASLAHLECLPADQASARDTRALAVVSQAGPQTARIEVGDPASSSWVTHTLQFSASDSLAQRWRATGYSIGPLLGDTDSASIEQEPDITPQAPTRDGTGVAPIESDDFATKGISLGGLVGSGLDRQAWRSGAELAAWASAWRSWFPNASVAYSFATGLPEQVRLRFVDLALGFGWRGDLGVAELNTRLRIQGTLQLITANATEPASGASETSGNPQEQSAWVPGMRVGADLIWPSQGRWAGLLKLDGLAQG